MEAYLSTLMFRWLGRTVALAIDNEQNLYKFETLSPDTCIAVKMCSVANKPNQKSVYEAFIV